MSWFSRRLCLIVALAMVPLGAPALAVDSARAVELADPKPDWDNPRRIVLQVSTNDPARFEGAMSNAINLQKFYGIDHLEVAIITFGGGVRHLMTEGGTAPDRVKSLQDYGVSFVACGNTMDTIGKTEADLVAGVTVVQVGIAEIVERGLRGWTTIVP
ncbi:MAG: DsrE family protein [Rhodospirillaceae bacterium]